MSFKKKPVDVLAVNQAKLKFLKARANNAIEVVTRTISFLEQNNKEIDETVIEIDDYVAKLSDTRNALVNDRKYNAAIITNFSKLLEVEVNEENEND